MSESAPGRDLPPASECVLVIFGAGGDLTKRKLLPALHNLASSGLLPERFAVLGVGSGELDDGSFRDRIDGGMADFVGAGFAPDVWRRIRDRLFYLSGDFRDDALYARLVERLGSLDVECGTGGRYLFYLATPPAFFETIVSALGRAGLAREDGERWRRVVIEKPFGHDLASAVALNRGLAQTLDERQIFRIDHYLGKETVQSILVYRFANGVTEPIWNRRYIDHVQITVAESLGVERRAGYYEQAGALRDMLPNHLLVLLGIVAMEPPNSFEADAVRDEIVKLLRGIQLFSAGDVARHTVRGQYHAGTLPDGSKVPGYRDEPGVAPTSSTETFVALKLMIDNWRWAGVPFYLRTGKRLPARYTEVAIHYRPAPFQLFRDTPVDRLKANTLVLRIQPREGIEFHFGTKLPGPAMRIGTVDMDFCYADYFGNAPSTGYETLIYDCMNGDTTLFRRADHVEAGWTVVQPIIDAWSDSAPGELPDYPAGSWGPPAADDLLARDGRRWRGIS